MDNPTGVHWFVCVGGTEEQILILTLNTRMRSSLFVTRIFLAQFWMLRAACVIACSHPGISKCGL